MHVDDLQIVHTYDKTKLWSLNTGREQKSVALHKFEIARVVIVVFDWYKSYCGSLVSIATSQDNLDAIVPPMFRVGGINFFEFLSTLKQSNTEYENDASKLASF